MKKHQRDEQGRAIPWIKSRFSKQYRGRLSIYCAVISGQLAANYARINAIRSSLSVPREKKKIALAQAIIEANISTAKTSEHLKAKLKL